MKKTLLLFILCTITLFDYGQTGCPNCVMDQNFVTQDGMPGINRTSFPAGCLNQYYQEDATLYLPGHFVYSGMNLTLVSVQILSVTGMPPGLNWMKDGGGTTWTVNGVTRRGCLRVCGTPTTAGVFTLTVTARGTVKLGFITQTQDLTESIQVYINDVPAAAGPIAGTAAVCQGVTGVAYGIPALSTATSYTWSYSGTGATLNGTGNNITIDYSSSATSGNLTVYGTDSCGNGPVSPVYAITVNSLPASAGVITGSSSVCQGATGIIYSVPIIANASSYTWNYSGTGATINGTGNSVTINFSSSATSGNLTVYGINACGNGIVSSAYAITVNPVPAAAGIITGTASVCQGATGIAYSVPLIANAASYTWSYSGAGATINGTGNSVTINFSASATSGNLTVRGTNACGNGIVSAPFAITVNPLPAAAGAITGTVSVCQGATGIAYSVPVIANATSYIWSYSGAGATINGTGNSVTINFSTSATSGNLTVRGTNACGNGLVSAPYAITVNPLPAAAGIITGTTSVCQGVTGIAYSVPVITNAVLYTWGYSGTGATINGTGNSITINFSSSATSGNLTVYGTNACGYGSVSSAYAITVNSLPAAAGIITGAATVCQGATGIAYSVPVIANAASYSWSYSGTGATINGTGNTITINFSTSASSGNLIVYGINACGNGIVSSAYAITVNPLPGAAGIITGATPVCLGTTGIAYSVPVIANAALYTWSYSGTGVTINGTGDNITIDYSSSATSGNLTVYGTNACGSGIVSSAYAITVNSLPAAAGIITGTATVCQGATGISYSVPVIANAASYFWSYTGTGVAINGTGNNITIDFSSSATSGNLTVYGTNACGNGLISSAYTITVNPLPVAAGNITGADSVCRGATGIAYSIPLIANASSYAWSYSGSGATTNGTGNSITINFSTSATSGNLTVHGTNACGNGLVSVSYAITVNPLPDAAGTITGATSVCWGATGIAYSVPVIAHTDSYSWNYSGTGVTIYGTGNNITIDFSLSATFGNLTVYGTNACGNGIVSAAYSITIDANSDPAGSITGAASVCQGATGIAYSVPVITHADSYTWNYSGTGAMINGSGNNITIDFSSSATSGDLIVYGTNACGNGLVSSAYTITANTLPAAAGNITGDDSVCQGATGIEYSIPVVANADSYTWNYSGTGVMINGTGNNITIDFSTSATSGDLTVYGTNACGSGIVSSAYAITVSPLPAAAGNIAGAASVCQGATGEAYSIPVIAYADSYTWNYSGTGAMINGTGANITIDFSTAATSGDLTVFGANICGSGGVLSVYAITVNPSPAVAGNITGATSVCRGTTGIAYGVPLITNAASYTWSYSGTGATINGTANSVTIDFSSSATSGNLTVYGTNDCGNGIVSSSYAITVNPLPAAAGIITGAASVCLGDSWAYSTPAIMNADLYIWSYSGNGVNIYGTSNPVAIEFTINATSGNLTVRGNNSCGNGTPSSAFLITVNSRPEAAGIISGTQTVCAGYSGIVYTIPLITGATSYHWSYSGTGAIIYGTGNTITMDFPNGTSSGILSVSGVNSCGNGDVATYYIMVDPCTGIEKNPNLISVHIVPNPSPGLFSIEFNSDANTTYRLKILDILGQTVMDKMISIAAGMNRIDVDMEDQPAGNYFLKMVNDQNAFVSPVIISR